MIVTFKTTVITVVYIDAAYNVAYYYVVVLHVNCETICKTQYSQ
jgi:hypothetical protein